MENSPGRGNVVANKSKKLLNCLCVVYVVERASPAHQVVNLAENVTHRVITNQLDVNFVISNGEVKLPKLV